MWLKWVGLPWFCKGSSPSSVPDFNSLLLASLCSRLFTHSYYLSTPLQNIALPAATSFKRQWRVHEYVVARLKLGGPGREREGGSMKCETEVNRVKFADRLQ